MYNCEFGILGQVWYLIVLIPDICTLTYFVFDPCFVRQYLISFLVSQSSHWKRENWLLYLTCLIGPVDDLQCVPVASPGHTYLLLYGKYHQSLKV